MHDLRLVHSNALKECRDRTLKHLFVDFSFLLVGPQLTLLVFSFRLGGLVAEGACQLATLTPEFVSSSWDAMYFLLLRSGHLQTTDASLGWKCF